MARQLLSLAALAALLAVASAVQAPLEKIEILPSTENQEVVVFQIDHGESSAFNVVDSSRRHLDMPQNRRDFIGGEPLNASHAVLYGQIANLGNALTFTAVECFDACQKLQFGQELYRFHHWQIGPVASEIESAHIVRAVQKLDATFWPKNKQGTTGALPKAYSKAIWIGLFGDAGQGNQSVPWIKTTASVELGAKYHPQWKLDPTSIAFWNNKGIEELTGAKTDYWWSPVDDTVQIPFEKTMWPDTGSAKPTKDDFYVWMPFQGNLDWSYEDWQDTFPKGGGTGTTPNFRPKACTLMTRATEWSTLSSMPYHDESLGGGYHHGRWENDECSSSNAAAGVCFCRAVCSIRDATRCLQSRKCSDDGTLIEENYEYNYTSCSCMPVPQTRCCTECGAESTGGRIVPTECRFMVNGDRDYYMFENLPTNPAPPMIAEATGPVPYSQPPLGPLRGWPACRRIIFNGVPISVGGATETLAPDGVRQGYIRRNLPEF